MNTDVCKQIPTNAKNEPLRTPPNEDISSQKLRSYIKDHDVYMSRYISGYKTASNVRIDHPVGYVNEVITLLVLFIVVDGIGHLIIGDPFL